MISNAQKALIKRAQLEAGLGDAEYREALQMIAGCGSSTDPGMTDRHVDLLLAYFEAIHRREVEAGRLQPARNPNAVFRKKGYWAEKNPSRNTSRDRYTASHAGGAIAQLEAALAGLGCGAAYCAAIRNKVTQGRSDARAMYAYGAALERTLKAKRAARQAIADPF